MYGKVNKFLQKAPVWESEKIPSYWIDKIFLNEPELDDGYFEEIDWLLGLFVKGLRSKAVSDELFPHRALRIDMLIHYT